MSAGTAKGPRAMALQLAWWAGFYRAPDRIILEDVILPRFSDAQRYRRVLFVGTRWYTRQYPARFRNRLITLDANPRMARYGATKHITDRLERLQEHSPPNSFDAIIVNGVIGWGLNRKEDVESALNGCYACLRPTGELVLGINEALQTTPLLDKVRALQRFLPVEFPGLGQRHEVKTPMAEGTHTYLFYRRP